MKQIFTSTTLLIFSLSFAQNGLENIITEKCYKYSTQDTNANTDSSILAVGLVADEIDI
jgi:hypothetical protein